MKAYKVSCEDDDHGAVIKFAARGRDLRGCRSDACDCAFIERRVKRAPEFDRYAPGPITSRIYLDHDWHFPCAGCSRLVWGEHCEAVILDDDSVFCGAECLRATLARYQSEWSGGCHVSMSDFIASMERMSAALPATEGT